MPLTTDDIDLEAELERLKTRKSELADQAASVDPENPVRDELIAEGDTVSTHIRGVSWAIENWETDSVTLIGLAGGEFGQVEDELADAAAKRSREGGQPGLRRIYLVAYGTQSAPYVDDIEYSDDEELIDKKLANTSDLPVAYLKWAETKINEMSTVGNENDRKSFSQLLQERQQAQNQSSTEST